MQRATNLVLAGFMGVGKTTVGRLVAAALERCFVDTDEEIARRAGRSIVALFDQEGEPAFRAWEARLAAELGSQTHLVMAVGGGFLLNPDNIRQLTQQGVIICLTATPETVYHRLKGDTTRPLLAGPDPLERIRALLAARAAIYQRWPNLPTDDQTPAEVAQAVLVWWAAQGEPGDSHLHPDSG